eukprot:SAG22_NODE_1811_length_3525_cov_12.037653_4_plen_292_part_00
MAVRKRVHTAVYIAYILPVLPVAIWASGATSRGRCREPRRRAQLPCSSRPFATGMYGVPDAVPWPAHTTAFHRPVGVVAADTSRTTATTSRSRSGTQQQPEQQGDDYGGAATGRSRSSLGDYSSRSGASSSRSYARQDSSRLFPPRAKSSFEKLGDDLGKGGSFIPMRGFPGYASDHQRLQTIMQTDNTTVYDEANEAQTRADRYRRRLQNRNVAEARIAAAYEAEEAEKLRKKERTINGVGRMRRDWENTIKQREMRMCRPQRKRHLKHDGHTLTLVGHGPLAQGGRFET